MVVVIWLVRFRMREGYGGRVGGFCVGCSSYSREVGVGTGCERSRLCEGGIIG